MNFQDVIRNVYDQDQNLLRTTAGGSGNSTVFIGTPTIFAVVNTSAAGQASVVLDRGHSFVGLATVNIGSSNATLFAVVNTSAAGQASVVLDRGHQFVGLVTATIGGTPNVALVGNVTTYPAQYSFYQQASLVSGYVYYGFALPGSNPTTANFKIQRETLRTGEVLYADGTAAFSKAWSAASLASIAFS